MKKLLLLSLIVLITITARAVTHTIYVKSETAPYLYSWYNIGGGVEQPLGNWPGTLMSGTELVKDTTFWKITISIPDEITSFNIIFNNGRGGQTEDILGLSSDRYYIYDGYTGYSDISEQFGKVPNAEISQVELRGDFNGWEEGGTSIMTKGDGYVYTMQVDLGDNTNDQQFKLVVNGSIYGGIESSLKIDAPEGWIEIYGAGTINETGYIILRNSIADYKSYILTATWEENPNAIDGWTLKVEGKDYKYELINTDEWQLLMTFYSSVDQSSGWLRAWDFSVETPSTKTLPGVNANDGHVVGIDLSNNQMSGTFPYALLALPLLKSLNLSDNHLTGDLGVMTYTFAQTDPTMMTHLQELNISGNQFSGNVGLFANCFPNLTSLNVSNNYFEDVNPMIPVTVKTLDLSSQTISRVVPLHLADLSEAEITTKVPSILLYDHANQTFTPNINLMCKTTDDNWGMMMTYQNGQLIIPYASYQNIYYGETGDTLNAFVYNKYGTPEGSNFRISLSFDDGDSNFDGHVNVLDLQTMINYMFEEYNSKPYNFTASNLWKDNVINVQDAVCMVNKLLDTEANSSQNTNNIRRQKEISDIADTTISIENAQLIINTDRPVASFDIIVSTNEKCEILDAINNAGLTCAVKRNGNQLHLVGYSLNGVMLPMGKTAICNIKSGRVLYAMLVDKDAQEITTMKDGTSTNIQSSTLNSAQSKKIVYRIPLGAKRAIIIDAEGNKTMINDEK